ncbi:MAG: MAPEG family protein, partial [Stellaceae bacterium]
MSDIVWLVYAVIVGMLHLGITAQMAQKYRTPDWGFGPRDTPMPTEGAAARMERAYRNFVETFPLFAAALIAVVV